MAKYALEVPLDASGVPEFKPDQPVKVLVQSTNASQSQAVQLNEKGQGTAKFEFPAPPGSIRILVGPYNATDEELIGLQTLSVDVSSRLLVEGNAKIPAIVITPYYWWWWRIWCREFVIRGRVICADGSPVPGARVCAFDVDWWFIWSSTQQVGCAFTDVHGTFEIRFRWCCGWWPWWWWRQRVWELNAHLAEQVGAVVKRAPDVRLSSTLSHQPSLSVFGDTLAQSGVPTNRALAPENVSQLDRVRSSVLASMPAAPELERLRIWPWWPWYPWWDCAPDIIFQVTQDCVKPGTVIVDETIANTRWDIPTSLNVTLIANQDACCRRVCPEPPCIDGECLVITQICNAPINEVGGNLGAPASPAGYLYPGAVAPGTPAYNGDRPFAGGVTVEKNAGALLNVDYYEIEQFDGGIWVPLPGGGAQDFSRRYMHMLAPFFPTTDVPFNFVTISGRNVVESKEHWEANSGLGVWGFNYIWLLNEFLVVPLDSTKFADGAHQFRVVGWQIAGGNLVNRRVLPICGTKQDNGLVLFFDNRVITALGHPVSHNCGGVHVCTTEPDTHISQVRINGQPVAPCGTVDAAAGQPRSRFPGNRPGRASGRLFARRPVRVEPVGEPVGPTRRGRDCIGRGHPNGMGSDPGVWDLWCRPVPRRRGAALVRWPISPDRAGQRSLPRALLLPTQVARVEAHCGELRWQFRPQQRHGTDARGRRMSTRGRAARGHSTAGSPTVGCASTG